MTWGACQQGQRNNPPRVIWAEREEQEGNHRVGNPFDGRAVYTLEHVFGVTMSWRLHSKKK